MPIRIILALFIMALPLALTGPLFAQDQESPPVRQGEQNPQDLLDEQKQQGSESKKGIYDHSTSEQYVKHLADDDLDIIEDLNEDTTDRYVDPTLENLSKMYWAIGKFDIAEDKLIDYYLMINECELYMQFYHNDFEWSKIQKATREFIMENSNSFPTHFEIMTPLSLGRYNQEKEEFEISDESKISGLKRLDFAMNLRGRKEVCTHSGDIYEYPPNIVVILNRPFFLDKIPVKRELAKLYIEEAKSFYDALPSRLQLVGYERLAFLRLKVKITQYKNTTRIVGGDLRAFVFGRIEGFEVYADQDKMKPLYIENLEGKRFRRLRRTKEQMDEIKENSAQPKVFAPDDKNVTNGDAAASP